MLERGKRIVGRGINESRMVRRFCLCMIWMLPAVSLNGQSSTSSVILHRMCGPGKFGLPGQMCIDCPQVALTHEYFMWLVHMYKYEASPVAMLCLPLLW